jgi:L-alanine-DL-glutamate epimerase-like enolase superfamily enzyme
MRLRSATVYCLQIPFVEAFRHAAKERTFSDSVVVRLVDADGHQGFGEGAPRPYVTGETVPFMRAHLCQTLLPALAGDLPPPDALGAFDAAMPRLGGAIIDNASRAAVELALLDCALRGADRPLAALLPPARTKIVYSGVITAGSPETVAQHARQMKLVGIRQVKIKVGTDDDLARIRAARDILGPEVSLRLDANGAWDLEAAAQALAALAPLGIAAVEQPLPRGATADLARLKMRTSIPIVVDESLVTAEDAEALIAARAADIFNVRVSKCGGLARSWALARRAEEAGLGVQVGSQVGETAILSAAGRHLAAAVAKLAFAEGSFGTLLLTEDVSAEAVRFGHRGEAPLLAGPGLGVRVLEDRLRKYAVSVDEVPLG